MFSYGLWKKKSKLSFSSERKNRKSHVCLSGLYCSTPDLGLKQNGERIDGHVFPSEISCIQNVVFTSKRQFQKQTHFRMRSWHWEMFLKRSIWCQSSNVWVWHACMKVQGFGGHCVGSVMFDESMRIRASRSVFVLTSWNVDYFCFGVTSTIAKVSIKFAKKASALYFWMVKTYEVSGLDKIGYFGYTLVVYL